MPKKSPFVPTPEIAVRAIAILKTLQKVQPEPIVNPATDHLREMRMYRGLRVSDMFGYTVPGKPAIRIEYQVGDRNLPNEIFESTFESAVVAARRTGNLPVTTQALEDDMQWLTLQRNKLRSFGRFLMWLMERISNNPGNHLEGLRLKYHVTSGHTEWYVEPVDAPGEQPANRRGALPASIDERITQARAIETIATDAAKAGLVSFADARKIIDDGIGRQLADLIPAIRREVKSAVREAVTELAGDEK